MVVTVSTVGVEANLAGRKVTQVRGSILDDLSPYLSMNIAQRELAHDEIVARLSQPVPAGAQTIHYAPGGAASRVLAVARDLASTRARA